MEVKGVPHTVETLEHRTLPEQIVLFGHAKVVLGQHGAGLANVVFARPGTMVIELGERLKLCYATLAQQMGFPYAHFEVTDYTTEMGEVISKVTDVGSLVWSVLEHKSGETWLGPKCPP